MCVFFQWTVASFVLLFKLELCGTFRCLKVQISFHHYSFTECCQLVMCILLSVWLLDSACQVLFLKNEILKGLEWNWCLNLGRSDILNVLSFPIQEYGMSFSYPDLPSFISFSKLFVIEFWYFSCVYHKVFCHF